MNNFRYILKKGGKKYQCPSCERANKYVRYIDTQTNDYLSDEYGRCDREDNCGYHLNPYKCSSFITHRNMNVNTVNTPRRQPKPVKYIPFEKFQQSRAAYDRNNFVGYLLTIFDAETVSSLIAKYHIGTSGKWKGATIFYQIDEKFRIRRGKIMLYDRETGKRIKEPFNHIGSVHKQLGISDDKPELCLFGLYLIKDSDKPVAVVESEKTAIIASVYLPDYTWLAIGAKGQLKEKNCTSLKGRNVTLFPDIGAYEQWSKEAEKLKKICNVNVSELLEQSAPAEHEGYDIVDYLTGYDLSDFIDQGNTRPNQDSASQPKDESQKHILDDEGIPADWYTPPLTEDDPEYEAYTRIAERECNDALELAMLLDPMLNTLIETFEFEVV
ncbi:MAG: DUF6371 domain-containing protein [Balneolales bacterium]